jgi:8-hydroxy-5-deazaflavin:NADPH oxidoreductase
MNFTIIGAGNMGRGIATRLLAGGNPVLIIDRDPSEAQKLAKELGAAAKKGATVSAAAMGSPIESEAVILAVFYTSVPSVLSQYGSQLAGKIIVDITNPLNATYDDLATPPGSSAAEEIAKIAPAGARVVKAFNTTFAGTLLSGQVAGQSLDVFVAGDDPQAKESLSKALSASGLRPIDVGPLRRARQLEGVGLLHITLQATLGTNWASTVKILS